MHWIRGASKALRREPNGSGAPYRDPSPPAGPSGLKELDYDHYPADQRGAGDHQVTAVLSAPAGT